MHKNMQSEISMKRIQVNNNKCNNNNNVFILPVKLHTNITESKGIQVMKIAQIIYNYYVKPDKTLDIYIVKLPSCFETLSY